MARRVTPHLLIRTAILVAAAAIGAAGCDRGVEVPPPVERSSRAPTMHATVSRVTTTPGLEAFPAFSPDGTRIAFCAPDDNGLRQVFIVTLDGGTPEPLTTGDYDHIQPAWTPDGTGIVFVRAREAGTPMTRNDSGAWTGGDIWVLALADSSEQRLVENASAPALSLDGTRLAFNADWSGAQRIYRSGRNGRNPKLASGDSTDTADHVDPAWSRDGAKIAYARRADGRFDIMAVDVKSGETVAVTDDRYRDLDPAWDPAADAVYFSSDRTGALHVWRVAVDARGAPTDRPEQVTAGAGPETQIAFTRDGGRMAFAAAHRNSDLFGLDVYPSTGEVASEPYPIEVTKYEETRGAWARDGKVIAFTSDRAGYMNLWIKSIVTSGTRQVTFGPGGDYQPEWHHDMRQLLFFSSRSGNPDIWNVDIQSGRFAQFTDEPSIECNPIYSPTTRFIAYESDVSGRMEVWVMRDDGSQKAQLSTTGVSGHFLLWMKDDDRIVFQSPGPDGPRLYAVSATTGEVTPFVDVAGSSDMTSSPDGALILGLVDHRSLWVTSAAGGAPEQVFELDEGGVLMDYPRWSPFGKRIMFDRYRPAGGEIRVVDGL